MTVAETSRQAYQQIQEGEVEKSQCQRILEAIKESSEPLTANELNNGPLADLKIPNGRIAARIKKLRENGEVQEAGKRTDKWTGREAMTWKTTDQREAIFQ